MLQLLNHSAANSAGIVITKLLVIHHSRVQGEDSIKNSVMMVGGA